MPTRSPRPPALAHTLAFALALLAVRLPHPVAAQVPVPALSGGSKPVTVYLVLDGDPVSASAKGNRSTVALAGLAARTRAFAARLRARQAELHDRLQADGVRVTGRFTRVANALRVVTTEDRIPRLASLPGVKAVHPARMYEARLDAAVPFVGAPAVWSRSAGAADGSGIRIGIIDSGIDYTHADFGGTGRVADYTANDPTRIEPGTFPTAKVVGGFDFAGDAYNAADDDHDNPVPDPDPLDCRANGHGTHVAGIAAGFGVTKDGGTYRGPYRDGIDFGSFAVGPGVAPGASLYALKVFGCGGSTALVTDALEWAADPNGDDDFSDRLDVVNLSLGGHFGVLDPEDTDLAAVRRLTDLGCVVVCAAGNNENVFYAVDAPGVAPSAITVANSVHRGKGQALEVLGPASVAGRYYFVEGAITVPLTNAGPVTGRLVRVLPDLACEPPTNAAELAGNIALIDRGSCLFSDKILAAQEAGATAVVMVNNQDSAPIPMGGETDGIRIPGGMISRADGERLAARLGEGVTVRLDAELSVDRAEFVDTLNDGSSRGPASPDNRLKPDLSAPGADVLSAKAGSGTEGASFTGTSMSTPLVAGAAALLRQLHPAWSVEAVKAALMNAARPIADPEGVPYPESRMGAGRLRLAEAASATVTAGVDSDESDVGISFGSLALSALHRDTRTVRLVNHSGQAVTYRLAVSNTVVQPGIEFRPVAGEVTIPPRESALVALELTADPAGFDPRPDGTTEGEIGAGTLLPRQFLYEGSGQLWFHAETGSLHLPYYVNARAAADFAVRTNRIVLPAATSTLPRPEVTIEFEGGSGSTNLFPLVSAFQLGATSPDKRLSDPNRAAADLLAVGAATDIASVPDFEDSLVCFGLALARDWTTPQPFLWQYNVLIDIDRDGREDFVVYNGNGSSTNSGGAEDAFLSVVLEIGPEYRPTSTNAFGYVNLFGADELETGIFNNNVLILPVPAAWIGLTENASSFRYQVLTFAQSGSVDGTGWIPFDAARPVLDTAYASPDGFPVHDDGFPIRVRVDREAAQRSGQRLPRVLLLHHLGTPGKRVEIVTLDLAEDDTDDDSLPDWWEQRYFEGLATAGRGTDGDGDGASDRHESQAGTDPTNPKSVFRMVSATRVSSRNIAVRWSGVAGQVFTLERSTDLDAGFDQVVRDDIEATPPLNSITDTNAAGPGPFFYRVRLRD